MYKRLLGLRDSVRTVRWSSLAFLDAASTPLCRYISASNFCFALQECSCVFGQLPGTHSVDALVFIVVILTVMYGRECRGVSESVPLQTRRLPVAVYHLRTSTLVPCPTV